MSESDNVAQSVKRRSTCRNTEVAGSTPNRAWLSNNQYGLLLWFNKPVWFTFTH